MTTASTFLARLGPRLLASGYRILPIPTGGKAPAADLGNWRAVEATPQLVSTWIKGPYKTAGTGIDARNAPAVDLDILDSAAVDHMKRFVFDRLGLAPVRIGQPPKALLAFRCEAAFDKVASHFWIDDEWAPPGKDGQPTPYRVEVLADGQQYVAFAVHPKTGKPYQWTENGSILDIPRDQLPLITEDDARAICAEFDRYAEAQGWRKKANAPTRLPTHGGKIDRDDVFSADKPKIDMPDDELRRHLMLAPGADSYETWFQVGMALYHQYDGEQEGLDLWHEWSATVTNYDSAALDAKWETFDAEGKGREPLTARRILQIATDHALPDLEGKISAASSMRDIKALTAEVALIQFDKVDREQLVAGIVERSKVLGKKLSVGDVRELAKYAPPSKEPTKLNGLPDWLAPWVYVENGNSYHHLYTRRSVNIQAFNDIHLRLTRTREERAEGKPPKTSPHQFAMGVAAIKSVSNRMYLPGQPDFFFYRGLECVNLYNPASLPDVPAAYSAEERAAVETIKAHIDVLFPGDPVLLDAFAWIVQNPGQRLNWAILMQGAQAVGKTIFHKLMAAVLGAENIKRPSLDSMQEKYSSWAKGYQIVFVEEVRIAASGRYDFLNKIKPYITDELATVRLMHTDEFEAVNTASFIMTTNFADALPLDEDDTRFYVVFSRFQTKDAADAFKRANPGYFNRLYGALEHRGALRKWLLEHPISPDFVPYDRAPPSPHKRQMIRQTESDAASAMKEILRDKAFDPVLFGLHDVRERMQKLDVEPPQTSAMTHILSDRGLRPVGKVRVEGRLVRFYSSDPARFLKPDGDTVDTRKVHDYLRNGDL